MNVRQSSKVIHCTPFDKAHQHMFSRYLVSNDVKHTISIIWNVIQKHVILNISYLTRKRITLRVILLALRRSAARAPVFERHTFQSLTADEHPIFNI